MAYSITLNQHGVQYIECLECGCKSYSEQDIVNKYCGRCHIYHDELTVRQIKEMMGRIKNREIK